MQTMISLETMIFVAQTGATGFLTLWLTLGLRDNLLYPSINGEFCAQVLRLDRMRDSFPSDYALMAHRRIENPSVHKLMFRLIVLAELVACVALWVGLGWMISALLGYVGGVEARTMAMLGVLCFTGVWSGFLIAGNHFAYWYCHEGAQNTHFQLAIWGVSTLVLLAIGTD